MEGTKNNHNIPNLFIVGAPKCGTTSMHNWLSQHPEIFMSEPKEPFYFCKDIIREADKHNKKATFRFQYRDKESYFSLFDQAKNEKYKGEASTIYLYSKEAPFYISQLKPDAKIIIMLREPVEFLYSAHSQRIRSGDENIKDFMSALKAEEQRKKNKKMPPGEIIPSSFFYKQMTEFSTYIEKYQQYFPTDQIKIVILEEIKEQPQKVYKEILEFLEVGNTQFLPEFNILNQNAKLRSKYLNNFIKNSYYVKKMVRFLFPDDIRRKITLTLEKKNKKSIERAPLDPETKEGLMKEFRPEVERLNEIVGKDLTRIWKYNNINHYEQ